MPIKGQDTNSAMDSLKTARARMTGSSTTIDKKAAEVPYMSVNEPALIHPWNQSMMKIRDNGTVDIFSGTDNGIRVNPKDRTIDLITKTKNTHATFVREFVLKDETHFVKRHWTIHAETATINTKKNTTVNADRQCVINTKHETIVNAEKDISLNTKGDFHMNADGDAYYRVGPDKQHFFS